MIPSEAFALFFKENSGPVFRALLGGTLNRAVAEVIVLVALGELTPTQAGRALGKPAGTVRSLLFQARVALHQALDAPPDPKDGDG